MIRSLVLLLTFVFINMSYAATYHEYGMEPLPVARLNVNPYYPSVNTGNYIHNHFDNKLNIARNTRRFSSPYRHPNSYSHPYYGGYAGFYGGYANSYLGRNLRYNYSYRIYGGFPIYSYQYSRPMYRIEQVQREFDLQKRN